MAEELRILHVDDEPALVDLVAEFLEREDEQFTVLTETSARDALARLEDEPIDGIVSDYDMAGMDGLAFLDAVRDNFPDLPFILFTGKGSEEIASRAISNGVTDYLQKGIGTEQYTILANRIKNAVERYRTRKALVESQQRLSLFIDQSPLGVVEWSLDAEVVRANDAAAEILGYERTDLEGTALRELVPESERERVDRIADELLGKSGGYHSVNENVTGDGERIICEWHNRTITDDDGAVLTIFSQFQDVTDRIERQRKLHELTQFRQAVIESANVWINVLDRDGNVVVWNDAAAEISGYTAEEVVGHDAIWEWLYPDEAYRSSILEYVAEILQGDAAAEEFETTILTADGDERILSWYSRAITDEANELIGSVAIGRDITERARHERELERQNDLLTEFAGLVSHDLQNPLAIAEGYVTLAREEGSIDHLDEVERAHDRMRTLIADFLSLVQPDEGDGTTVVSLSSIVNESIHNVEPADATVVVESDRLIRTDAGWLRRLIENLLQNAVHHGGSDVTVTIGGLDDGFYVEDDGPGIDPADRERVFETGYSTASTGTGFGLTIVRRIAEDHDWHIAVTESDEGGARFEITGVEPTFE